MRDTSGISYSFRRKPVSLSWSFDEHGTPVSLTIAPHDRTMTARVVIFENGKRFAELLNPASENSQTRRYQ